MPRLTVMMPARNAGRTIAVALRSTLLAAPRDSEIFVLDDASTDDTAQIAERIKDRRVTVVRSEINLGGGDARTRILDSTDSMYVASMDADDITLPWRFAVQFPLLRNADFCFAPAIWFRVQPPRIVPKNMRFYSATDSAIALLFHSPFAHPTLLAKRGPLMEAGGYSNLARGQDYELWLRSAARGFRLVRTGVPSLLYRESPGQVSGAPDFAQALRAQPRLWESYHSLAAKFFPDRPDWSFGPDDDLNEDRVGQLFADLGRLVPSMRRPHRRHYTAYATKQIATMIASPSNGR